MIRRAVTVTLLTLALISACEFDVSLREFLSRQFWLPFTKQGANFEKPNVRRASTPFAGMADPVGESPLAKLREAYRDISSPGPGGFDLTPFQDALAAARAVPSLTSVEREEIDLIDAKIDLRAGGKEAPQLSDGSRKKLEAFLRTARSPELLSEARGWLAHLYYREGNQTAAGKIYLDELNRNGSNLSREVLLSSLETNYGFNGGAKLIEDLDQYFDTPEHAAFAIQLATNPRIHWFEREPESGDNPAQTYARIKGLLQKHSTLLRANGALPLLSMRTALRMGDPAGASTIAAGVPANAPVRSDPDFLWMQASAHFLSGEYAAAEAPLLALFQSRRAQLRQKGAAAYGLCGVYRKTGNIHGRLRYALWLRTTIAKRPQGISIPAPASLADFSLYWPSSGFDLNLILDAEAPVEALQSFIEKNPRLPDIRLVQYAVAVRLARENKYEEAAAIYQSINALRRAPRMRQMAALYRDATTSEGKFRLAEFLSENSDRIYFNDSLWSGLQSFAVWEIGDSRLTPAERTVQIELERKLKDDQEERWRAYLILRDVVRDEGQTELGRKAARLAIQNLRRLNPRFKRQEEIRKADIELSRWLLHR